MKNCDIFLIFAKNIDCEYYIKMGSKLHRHVSMIKLM